MSGATILVVDDEDHYRELLRERLGRAGCRVLTAADGAAALAVVAEEAVDVALLDIMMPGMDGLELLRRLKAQDALIEAVMLTGHASIDSAIAAMKAGAFDYLSKPYKLAELDLVVQRAVDKRRLETRCAGLSAEIEQTRGRQGELIGTSPAWQRTVAMVHKAAAYDVAVLITGESGVGKEMVAGALHRWGPRAKEPFVPIDCSALPEALVESEMFGHRRGAFTGALADKEGLFQTAATGTIFLDEIGELPLASQAKLLRVLETREFRPVGHTALRRTNARVVAATNRDLARAAADGRFRHDLLFRLNVLNIHVPPLRERREDIPALLEHFLGRSSAGRGRRLHLGAAAMQRLLAYPWPGNARELRNMAGRLAVLSERSEIDPSLVGQLLGAPSAGAGVPAAAGAVVPLDELEQRYVRWALDECGGNITIAARRLKISRSRLYRLFRSLPALP